MHGKLDCIVRRGARSGRRCASGTAIAALLMLAAPGCSLFHRHSVPPQQQFINALKSGNGPQANQIWLSMTPEDRANLSHSVELRPPVSKEELQTELARHQAQSPAADAADQGLRDALSGEIQEGDINSQQVELPGLDIDPNANGLQSLPGLSGADAVPQFAPDSEPSN
jgi:hypothetical protein